jgi:hypothetical protein
VNADIIVSCNITKNREKPTTKLKMNQPKKVNYFYIDESGSISNDSNIFIHGCIKTDSPITITDSLLKLKKELRNSLYYDEFRHKIVKQGFMQLKTT